MAYVPILLPVVRDAGGRLPKARWLTVVSEALFRPNPRSRRKSSEEHLDAQERREAARRAVDRLLL